MAWHQRQWRREAFATRCGAQHQTRRATAPRELRLAAVGVGAKGQRRPALSTFPSRRKSAVPGIACDDVPSGVGALKLASPQAAKHLHLAHTQHHQIGLAVAIDVQRISAVGIGQLQAAALFQKFDGAAARAFVAVKLGTVDACRHVDFGQPIAIAIKRRNPAADQELAFAFKATLKPRGIGFFNEAGHGGCLRLGARCDQQHSHCHREHEPTTHAASL